MSELYFILQVHPAAEPEIITAAYRQLVRKYHPDAAPPHLRTQHQERLQAVNGAYEVLSDPTRRSRYDAGFPEGVDSGRGDSRPTLCVAIFEAASELAGAAEAGGGAEECYRRSAKLFETVIEEAGAPELVLEAQFCLLEVLYHGLKHYARAEKLIESLFPGTDPGPVRDELLLALADCQRQSNRWDEARQTYLRAVRECTDPEALAAAHVGVAGCECQLGSPRDAVTELKKVLENHPQSAMAPLAQYQLGRILDSDLHRYVEAIAAYEAVLRLYPDSEFAEDCQWRVDYLRQRHLQGKGVIAAGVSAFFGGNSPLYDTCQRCGKTPLLVQRSKETGVCGECRGTKLG